MTKGRSKTLIFITLDTPRFKSGYIEEKNGNKYLIFDSADENKEVLKNTQMFGMKLKTKSKQ